MFLIVFFFAAFGVLAVEINSKTVIVVDKDAIPAEITAAKELQKYFEKITGNRLDIVSELPKSGSRVVVGNGSSARSVMPNIDFGKLMSDEILLLSPDSNTLLVAGERPRGTLYAAYALLEKEFGVRFLSKDHELVPTRSMPVTLNLNYRYAPPFCFRENHGDAIVQDHALAAKWRLNGSMYRPKIPAELGGCYQMDMSHSLLNRYVKEKEWFGRKPEWFSFRNKENARIPKQLCLSNPEVVAQVVKEVLAEQKQMPERRFIGIGAQDNSEWCECEKCLKLNRQYGTTGAGMWMVANAVAKAVSKEYPAVEVMYMAYWSTERPPEGLKLEPNISVVLGILDRNHGLPPSATPRYDAYLEKYNQLTNDKVYIWDYYATFCNFLLPTPNLDVIEPALRTYKKYKVKGIFVQVPFGTLGEFVEFRNYLLAQLMWNPQLDSRKLMKEFFNNHYGKAADSLIAYVDLLNQAKARQKGTWIGCYSEKTDHWLTTKDVLDANALFRQALAATVSNPEENRRVRGLEASLILVNILRYQEINAAAKKVGITLKSRDELINQLEALGKEFKCGVYKEWDSFENLIKRLRSNDNSKVAQANLPMASQVIPAEKLTGTGFKVVDGVAVLPSQQVESAFSWMEPKNGEIAYVITPEQAGRRQVSITLRSIPAAGTVQDAAYLGIYAPHEICRVGIGASAGDPSWQQICLGEYELSPGSRIWVMPGVTAFSPVIEVKELRLY